MSARTKARKRALDILYAADVRGTPIAELLAEETIRAQTRPERASSWDYARTIAVGVDEHLVELDATIQEHSTGWSIARMPAIDRAIARICTWEILHNEEVPDPVAIAEAVESAGELSTDDSAGFLGGLLGAIARDKSSTAPTA